MNKEQAILLIIMVILTAGGIYCGIQGNFTQIDWLIAGFILALAWLNVVINLLFN